MRIVAISDQHGHLPPIPECDLLIVAGDLCPDIFKGMSAKHAPERQWKWFREEWRNWLNAQPVKECLVTWGNHDFCGLDCTEFTDLLSSPVPLRVVCDNEVTIHGLRIYLTPWSNQFMQWAFMRQPDVLARYYSVIPEGLDILVSHQPPMGYGSTCKYLNVATGKMVTEQVGSAELLDVIKAKRPNIVICGHVHSGYGTYYVDEIIEKHDVTITTVYNVSVVNEAYDLVNPPTLITI